MRTVDTNEINTEIERLKAEKRQLGQELEELDNLANRLPELEEEHQQLNSRLGEK